MGAYNKETIVSEKTVAGNIRDFRQLYDIVYYPRQDDLPEKIAMYIYLRKKDEEKEDNAKMANRSLFFSSKEQLKDLIVELSKAYLFFVEKKIKPDFNLLPKLRGAWMNDLLAEIITTMKEEWKNE